MEKRFVVAIILIFAVLFLMPQLFRSRRQPPLPPPQETREAEERQKSETEEPEPEIPPQEILPQVSEETIITVQTPLYEVQLTTEGARAISWKLREYLKRSSASVEETEDSEEPMFEERSALSSIPKLGLGHIDLIPLAAKDCLAIKFEDFEVQDELEGIQWASSAKGSMITIQDSQKSVVFSHKTSTGVIISKKMTFSPDSYAVDVDVSFHNTSLEEADLGSYSFLWGKGIEKDEMLSDMEVAGEGPVALFKTEKKQQFVKFWKRTGFACFGGKHVLLPEQSGPISWVGFASKYFAAVLIPGPESWWSDMEKGGMRYAVEPRAEDLPLSEKGLSPKDVWQKWGINTTIALVRPDVSLYAGENVSHKFRVYAGPKKWDILRSIKRSDDSTENLGLGKMINFGFFSPLGKATLWLLKFLYGMVNNYGICIIFLTILIKILYFPLTQKSFKSMQKMQKLQPKIATLREKHRDDPQRLQKETMKLYKQNKVHPMGGCLPLVFQIPVFWALFATLRGAVELRGAVFISGWVNDLSLPDTVASVVGFPIRILPLLMTGSMLAQQFIFGTGSTGQGQSNKMMAFMPLIFAFIFYGMPSGLVLYWLCNNILAIGHQYLIRRQKDTEMVEQEEIGSKKNRSNREEK